MVTAYLKLRYLLLIFITVVSLAGQAYGEIELEWIAQSKIKGTVRSIYQFRELDTKPDEEIYSLGINLKWESAPIYDFNVGSAVYASTDMGLTLDGLASQNGVIPVSSIAVFAEAYVQQQIRYPVQVWPTTGGHTIYEPGGFAHVSRHLFRIQSQQ